MILKEILFWIGYYQIRVWSGTHPLQDLVKLAILLKKVHFMGVRGEHKWASQRNGLLDLWRSSPTSKPRKNNPDISNSPFWPHLVNILHAKPMKCIKIPSVWKRKENDHQILFMVTKCRDKSFCIHWILCSWRFYEALPVLNWSFLRSCNLDNNN